ncbi:MAG: MerC family mercury resistance protein, partial [Bacteroidetes bacterium]|nr:MerC family mercury resistance protein [Bacteroidota bacterium]
MSKNLIEKLNWDKVGICLSGLCALHCLLVPVFVALMPLWSVSLIVNEWVHPLFLFFIFPTIVLAVKKSKSNKSIKILLSTGMAILVLAWLLHSWVSHTVEIVITLIGSATLITGHWKNFK